MKKAITIIIYTLILVFSGILFFLMSRSFSQKKKIKPENITIKTVNLLIEYENTNQIDIPKIEENKEYIYKFNIKNDDPEEIGEYKLNFQIISPLFNALEKNFIYSLNCTASNDDTSNKLVKINNKVVPINDSIIGKGTITPETTHSCIATFKLNTLEEKKDLSNTVFSAKMKLEGN